MWVEDIDSYLKIDDLIVGNLYAIYSRGIYTGHGVAIYNGDGFFDSVDTGMSFCNFQLMKELHWDMDKQYGTVKPVRDLGKCPANLDRWKKAQLLKFLSKPMWNKDSDEDFADSMKDIWQWDKDQRSLTT
jgi:hypothetical protein